MEKIKANSKVTSKSIKEKYENLRTTVMALAIILLVVIVLFVVAFYKGWLGEPGKIYFSPNENDYYLRCVNDKSICGDLGVCEKVSILKPGNDVIEDSLCFKR